MYSFLVGCKAWKKGWARQLYAIPGLVAEKERGAGMTGKLCAIPGLVAERAIREGHDNSAQFLGLLQSGEEGLLGKIYTILDLNTIQGHNTSCFSI